MSTAKQLIPSFVDASPLTWDRAYTKNMRPIRGYPDYWRIVDTESYIDGPPSEGERYDGNFYLWRAKILEDEDFNLTDTFEVVNLKDFLTATSEEVDGETIYSYKYNSNIDSFQYQHTDVIDSISIEFDQLGRKTFAFESAGDVYLIFYDSQLGSETTRNFGSGYNPQIVTDTYRRTAGSADSERLLFYVDGTTNQIVYRRQSDRFGVVYTLPDAPENIVELLKVSKNIYGGLTAVYCYDNGGDGVGEGSLATGSFTARSAPSDINIGTDDNLTDSISFVPSNAKFDSFRLYVAGVPIEPKDSVTFGLSNASIPQFSLALKEVPISAEDSVSFSVSNATISQFSLEEVAPPEINIATEDSASFSVSNANIPEFELRLSLINVNSEPDSATFTTSNATFESFTLA